MTKGKLKITTQQKRDKHTEFGKGWCEHGLVSIDPYEHFGRTIIGVNIGEERFETDPYTRKDFALCEAKGWLEGVKAQIEGVLEGINKEIEDFKEE